MIIVHVHHHYWPVVGGLENAVKALAEEQVKLGHEVHVITSTYGAKNRPREEIINGVHIHRIKATRILNYPDLTYPLEYPKLLKDADVVHGHSQNSLFTVKLVEEAKRRGAKTAVYFMAVDALGDHPSPIIRALGPAYAKWALRKALRATDIKLAKSRRDVEMLRGKYGVEDVHYVPDGVDKGLLEASDRSEEFKKRYGIDSPFVMYLGRLHPMKGLHVLIRAMTCVIREVADAKAVVIGPGDQRPYRELAERLGIAHAVKFLGYVDEETKIAALDASRALVLPSVSDYVEVFSIAISEAWARSRPVIASAVGEIPYRVGHMENGLLVPPRNHEALAKAIITLLEDEQLAKKLGARGKQGVYTWEEVAKEVEELIARL